MGAFTCMNPLYGLWGNNYCFSFIDKETKALSGWDTCPRWSSEKPETFEYKFLLPWVVWKCTWDFAFIQVWWSQLTDQGTICIWQDRICYSRFPRGRGTRRHAGPCGEAPGWSEGREWRESRSTKLDCGCCSWNGWGLGVQSLNTSGRLWQVR